MHSVCFFAWVSSNIDRLWADWSSELDHHDWGNSDFPFVGTDIARDQLKVCKSIKLDGIHPRVLMAVTAEPLSSTKGLGILGRAQLTAS